MSWTDFLNIAGDLPAFQAVWIDVQAENPALEIGVLAARIGYLLTTIPGGSAAGFPSVMTQYCSAYYNDMAEAGLFGPAVPTVSDAGSVSPAVEGTSLDGTPTEHGSSGQPLLGQCAASSLSHASNVAKGTAMAAEASATGPAAPAHDSVASSKCRRRPRLMTKAAVTAAGSRRRQRAPDDTSMKLTGIKEEHSSEDNDVSEEGGQRGQAVTAAVCTSMVQSANSAQHVSPRIISRPAGDAFCACCGVCGNKRCAVAKNQFYRNGRATICAGMRANFSNYCSGCVCEVLFCYGPRFRSRWCKTHIKTHSVEDSRRLYSNPYSCRLSYQAQWPTELRVIARVAFALPRTLPTDAEVLMMVMASRETLTPLDIVKLFIAHAIKWPWVVGHFYE